MERSSNGQPAASSELCRFDELYVVSDLLLGGQLGDGQHFGLLVDALTLRPSGERVGLVLNGNTLDFGADDSFVVQSESDVSSRFGAALDSPAVAPVVASLRRFLRTRDRRLVWVMGNRELPLVFPAVREMLEATLCGNDSVARRRLSFSIDDSGYYAYVGSARVLCVHGHQVDPFYQVDRRSLVELLAYFEAKRSPFLANSSDDLKPPRLRPSRGAVLERKIMVPLWNAHPWLRMTGRFEVNVQSALLFLVLPPWHILHAYVALFEGHSSKNPFRPRRRWLPGDTELADRHEDRVLGPPARVHAVPTHGPLTTPKGAPSSMWRDLWNLFLGMLSSRRRRHAIRHLLQSPQLPEFSADLDWSGRKLDEVAGEADFLVAGHTHSAGAFPRRKGKGYYLNPGSWAGRLRPTRELLESEEAFAPVYKAMTAGSIGEMDRVPNLISRRRLVAVIRSDDSGFVSELCELDVESGALSSVKP